LPQGGGKRKAKKLFKGEGNSDSQGREKGLEDLKREAQFEEGKGHKGALRGKGVFLVKKGLRKKENCGIP